MTTFIQSIAKLHLALDQCQKNILKVHQTDLTLPQYHILASIAHLSQQHIAVTQIMAAEHAVMDAMTASQVIKNLEKKQLLFRTASLEDSRAKALYLTNKGQHLIGQLMPLVDQALSQLLQPIANQTPELCRLFETILPVQ